MEAAPSLSRSTVAYAWFLIVGGVLGLTASFNLMLDKIALMNDPNVTLTCSINSTVQCTRNLGSWQGSVFWDVPNPVWGLMAFVAPVAVGVALLAGAKFRPWFWALFTAGMWAGTAFVFWLAYQSIFNLHTLCPWCALVYVVMIPMWVSTTFAGLRAGMVGAPGRTFAEKSGTYVPVLLTVVALLVIFGTAQLQLNVIGSFFA